MEEKYIIVEGEQDRRLLAAIFPALASHVKLVAAGGYSAALSKAATVLAYLHKDTLLALDADTADDGAAAEKEQFVTDYLKSSRNGNELALVLFKPTLLGELLENDSDGSEQQLQRDLRLTRIWKALSLSPDSFTKYQALPALQKIKAFAETTPLQT